MKNWQFALVAILLMAGTARTTAQETRPVDGINPEAPRETSQYAFMLGKWNISSRYMQQDRSYVDGKAWTESRLILDGFAFQTVWQSESAEGGVYRSTTIRKFSVNENLWIEVSIPMNSEAVKILRGKFSDGQITIFDEGEPRKSRHTFYDISEDHYKLKADVSFDGGENWINDIAVHEFNRADKAGTIHKTFYTRSAVGINPEAPKESSQYAFMLGKWDVSARYLKPDGTYQEGKAWSESRLIHNGFAFQSFWRSETADGGMFRGTAIRTFDVKVGQWVETFIPMNSDVVMILRGRFSDGQMVIEGDGDHIRTRNTFCDISEDHYKLKADKSFDGGEHWVTDVELYDYNRTD